MLTLQIIKGFQGPSVLELDRSGVLDEKAHAVEAAWTNTRAEVQVVRHRRHVHFVLTVSDIQAQQRAASTLGIALHIPEETLTAGRTSLQSREAPDWRAFSLDVGAPVARSLLVRYAGDVLRAGNNPGNLRRVVEECLVRGVSAYDADVLLGLGAA